MSSLIYSPLDHNQTCQCTEFVSIIIAPYGSDTSGEDTGKEKAGKGSKEEKEVLPRGKSD